MAWERGFFEKQWAASGSLVDFATYLRQIEFERETMRKRARDPKRHGIRQGEPDKLGAVQCSVSGGQVNAAQKLADATKRLRETRALAARLPDGPTKAKAIESIDRIAAELASGVAGGGRGGHEAEVKAEAQFRPVVFKALIATFPLESDKGKK